MLFEGYIFRYNSQLFLGSLPGQNGFTDRNGARSLQRAEDGKWSSRVIISFV